MVFVFVGVSAIAGAVSAALATLVAFALGLVCSKVRSQRVQGLANHIDEHSEANTSGTSHVELSEHSTKLEGGAGWPEAKQQESRDGNTLLLD